MPASKTVVRCELRAADEYARGGRSDIAYSMHCLLHGVDGRRMDKWGRCWMGRPYGMFHVKHGTRFSHQPDANSRYPMGVRGQIRGYLSFQSNAAFPGFGALGSARNLRNAVHGTSGTGARKLRHAVQPPEHNSDSRETVIPDVCAFLRTAIGVRLLSHISAQNRRNFGH